MQSADEGMLVGTIECKYLAYDLFKLRYQISFLIQKSYNDFFCMRVQAIARCMIMSARLQSEYATFLTLEGTIHAEM